MSNHGEHQRLLFAFRDIFMSRTIFVRKDEACEHIVFSNLENYLFFNKIYFCGLIQYTHYLTLKEIII